MTLAEKAGLMFHTIMGVRPMAACWSRARGRRAFSTREMVTERHINH